VKKASEYEKAMVTKPLELLLFKNQYFSPAVGSRNDNPNTTQSLEYSKDKYNVRIRQ
jgi:hypothetical protein